MSGVKSTIRSSEEISALFKTARRQTSPHLLVLIAPSPTGRDQKGRVAFIAGKRLGNAPYRSRSKRVMREAVRLLGLPGVGYDLALIAREETALCSPSMLADELGRMLARQGQRAEVRRGVGRGEAVRASAGESARESTRESAGTGVREKR